MCHTFHGDYGILDVSQLKGHVRPPNDHFVKTRLVSLENTHNRGGGRIFPLDKIRAIRFEFLDKTKPPASTMLLFEGLPAMDASFALEVIALP